MPIDTSLIGTAVGPNVEEVDARWAMAYAAGLGDMQACYMDTRREGGIIAHPMFPVCVEWQIAGKLRAKHRVTLSQAEAARGVHATQHMIFHRPIRPPMKLSTTASIEGIERRRPGPYEVVKYATVDEHGTPVCTTYAGSIYREVEMKGVERPAVTPAVPVSTERSPKAWRSLRSGYRRTRRMSIRNARISGTRFIRMPRWRRARVCRRLCCMARRHWRWRCRRLLQRKWVIIRKASRKSTRGSVRWCLCRRRSSCGSLGGRRSRAAGDFLRGDQCRRRICGA